MDARELTKLYYDLRVQTDEQEKRIKYLEQEAEKLRLLIDDLNFVIQQIRR